MRKPYIKVFLKKDMGGTYFVSATILEDGKPSTAPYPAKYKKLVNKWDNLFPHLPFQKLKKKVTQDAKSIGYGIEVKKD